MFEEFGKLLQKPSDLDAKLWRFIDIPKFVSLLDKEALYFSNSNTFDDPYEGRIGNYNKNFDIRLKKFRGRLEGVKDDNLKRLILAPPDQLLKIYKTRLLTNCWHLNYFESAAMWDLYSNRNSGIAIQSTFRRLCNSFHKTNFTIHIGEVKYIDFDTQWMKEDLFLPFLYKRPSFKHEQEVRAFTIMYDSDLPNGKLPKDLILPSVGKSIKTNIEVFGEYIAVNLGELIERVYVSPKAPKYFEEVAESIVRRYGLSSNLLKKSDLYSLH